MDYSSSGLSYTSTPLQQSSGVQYGGGEILPAGQEPAAVPAAARQFNRIYDWLKSRGVSRQEFESMNEAQKGLLMREFRQADQPAAVQTQMVVKQFGRKRPRAAFKQTSIYPSLPTLPSLPKIWES